MSYYFLRKVGTDVQIAKFEDYSEPVAVYVVGERGCSCPARVRVCKHAKLAKQWSKKDYFYPAVFDENGSTVETYF